jgi:hypothetical protein
MAAFKARRDRRPLKQGPGQSVKLRAWALQRALSAGAAAAAAASACSDVASPLSAAALEAAAVLGAGPRAGQPGGSYLEGALSPRAAAAAASLLASDSPAAPRQQRAEGAGDEEGAEGPNPALETSAVIVSLTSLPRPRNVSTSGVHSEISSNPSSRPLSRRASVTSLGTPGGPIAGPALCGAASSPLQDQQATAASLTPAVNRHQTSSPGILTLASRMAVASSARTAGPSWYAQSTASVPAPQLSLQHQQQAQRKASVKRLAISSADVMHDPNAVDADLASPRSDLRYSPGGVVYRRNRLSAGGTGRLAALASGRHGHATRQQQRRRTPRGGASASHLDDNQEDVLFMSRHERRMQRRRQARLADLQARLARRGGGGGASTVAHASPMQSPRSLAPSPRSHTSPAQAKTQLHRFSNDRVAQETRRAVQAAAAGLLATAEQYLQDVTSLMHDLEAMQSVTARAAAELGSTTGSALNPVFVAQAVLSRGASAQSEITPFGHTTKSGTSVTVGSSTGLPPRPGSTPGTYHSTGLAGSGPLWSQKSGSLARPVADLSSRGSSSGGHRTASGPLLVGGLAALDAHGDIGMGAAAPPAGQQTQHQQRQQLQSANAPPAQQQQHVTSTQQATQTATPSTGRPMRDDSAQVPSSVVAVAAAAVAVPFSEEVDAPGSAGDSAAGAPVNGDSHQAVQQSSTTFWPARGSEWDASAADPLLQPPRSQALLPAPSGEQAPTGVHAGSSGAQPPMLHGHTSITHGHSSGRDPHGGHSSGDHTSGDHHPGSPPLSSTSSDDYNHSAAIRPRPSSQGTSSRPHTPRDDHHSHTPGGASAASTSNPGSPSAAAAGSGASFTTDGSQNPAGATPTETPRSARTVTSQAWRRRNILFPPNALQGSGELVSRGSEEEVMLMPPPPPAVVGMSPNARHNVPGNLRASAMAAVASRQSSVTSLTSPR